LIGAQATRVIAPQRLGYIWVLLLAAAGLVCGEGVAQALRSGGPQLGLLHPAADVAGVAGFEVVGALLAPSRRRGP
jgi:hypothetical protein